MASSPKGTYEMAALTPSPTVPPVGSVIINIPNTSSSPAPAADPPSHHHHQLLDQAPTDQNQQPNAVVEQPDAVVEQPDAVVEQPDAVVEQPGALVGQPGALVGQPDAGVGQPDAAVGQPDAGVGQPDAAVGQPDAVAVRPTCEKQIINLVEMQIEVGEVGPDAWKKRVAQEALREWKEAQSELQGKVERRTKQTDKLIFEIYQLIGLYSVFVGVVFTAAVQSQILRCQHIWSPVLLCAVAWLIIILVTQKRWRKYRNLRATIKGERTSRGEISGQISRLKAFGYEEFDFAKHAAEQHSTREVPTQSTICGVRVPASWVIPFVLTALTLVLVGSFIHILCFR